MRILRFVFIVSVLLILCMLIAACNEENEENKYTDEEFNEMTAMELYNVFLENGLKVDKDLLKALTKYQLAKFFKSDFDLLVKGMSSRSHNGYMKMAKDTKTIYEKIKK
ncbi:hypothetical protein PV797_08710 [Clostridiaceae bacterium M8S5]|nr:hypothetical protein PV797_08710 [Clostridiaceae bacterium M8S5]